MNNLLQAPAQEPDDHEYVLFPNRKTGPDRAPSAPRFRPGRILWEQFVLSTGDCDLPLNPGFTASWSTRCPQLTWSHDLQKKRHPEYFKPAGLLAWRHLVWAAARRSQAILTLSENSREDIHEIYKVPLDRIYLAPPGVGELFPTLNAQRTEPIVLRVSTLHPHKGIETLLEAFEKFRQTHREYRLVLAGRKGFHTNATEAKAGSNVEITGWLDRKALSDLYRRARLFVFPSTFEGFGMPILEAMAAAVPTICADGARHFPPGITAALAEQMEKTLTTPGLIERGKQRDANFTRQKTAKAVLRAVAESQKSVMQ